MYLYIGYFVGVCCPPRARTNCPHCAHAIPGDGSTDTGLKSGLRRDENVSECV